MNRVRRTHLTDARFTVVVGPHLDGLHAHCRKMLGSREDADDALQNVLLRAWRGLHRFEGRSSVRAWLYRIATNACLDEIAARKKRSTAGDDTLLARPGPDTDTPEVIYAQREAVRRLLRAACALPPRQRDALILRDGFGFSTDELAEALGVTPTAVHSAAQRARAALDPAGRSA